MHYINRISGFIARSVEDRISWGRVVARDEDLYGKKSRHWSTSDPIQILVVLWATWLAMAIGGAGYKPPQLNQDDLLDAAGCVVAVKRGVFPLLVAIFTQLLFCLNASTFTITTFIFSLAKCSGFIYSMMSWLIEHAASQMGITRSSLRKLYAESITLPLPAASRTFIANTV